MHMFCTIGKFLASDFVNKETLSVGLTFTNLLPNENVIFK